MEMGCGRTSSFGDADDLVQAVFEESDHSVDFECATLCRNIWSPSTGLPDGYESMILNTLAQRLYFTYDRWGNVTNLDESINIWQQSLTLPPPISDAYRMAIIALGVALRLRSENGGVSEDLESSLRYLRRAVQLCRHGHILRPIALQNLGTTLLRHALCSLSGDFTEILVIHREALVLAPPEHPERCRCLLGLAEALCIHFNVNGDKNGHIHEALELYGEANLLCGGEHPDRPRALHGRAVALALRYEVEGNIADVDSAIDLHENVLSLCATSHILHASSAYNLANMRYMRFVRLGIEEDLDRAIQLYDHIMAGRPRGHPAWYLSAANLILMLRRRFETRRSLFDIDRAIELSRALVAKQHPDSPGYAILVGALDLLMQRRDPYSPTNGVVQVTPLQLSGHQGGREAIPVKDCGSSDVTLSRHLIRPLDTDDVLEASPFSYWKEQLAFLAETPPGPWAFLKEVGVSLTARATTTANPAHARLAIAHLRGALERCPTGHPGRPTTLCALAEAYNSLCRIQKSHSIAHTTRDLLEESIALFPLGHSSRATCLFDLAMSYLDSGEPSFDPDLAIHHITSALDDDYCNVHVRLEHARRVLQSLTSHTILLCDARKRRMLRVYRLVIRLLPRMTLFGLDLASRLQAITNMESLVIDGALLSLALCEVPVALEILEQGRGIFWSESLKLRTVFDDIPSPLGTELRELGLKLDHDVSDASHDRNADVVSTRLKQGARFAALVEETRCIPGLERFLLPPQFSTLSQAADNGPVVVLVSNPHSCAAIVLSKDLPPSYIALDSVTKEWLVAMRTSAYWRTRTHDECRLGVVKSKRKRCQQHPGLSGILEQLWEKVVSPILNVLHIEASTGHNRRRLWWCCTSLFAGLPVHAAGIYPNGPCCSDYIVSSYIPTISALLNLKQSSKRLRREDTRVLLAAVPSTESWNAIPSTIQEVKAVAGIVPPAMLIKLPASENVLDDPTSRGLTLATCIQQIPSATVLHLACHGIQDPRNLLDSGFVLADGLLKISRMMSIPRSNAFLAFLSACGTARVDSKQADLTVHLASSMLFAGFQSVIATLWSMEDVDGPPVAKTVYERLFSPDVHSEYLDPEAVPYALDAAVRKLRDQGLGPERWAPYVHVGYQSAWVSDSLTYINHLY